MNNTTSQYNIIKKEKASDTINYEAELGKIAFALKMFSKSAESKGIKKKVLRKTSKGWGAGCCRRKPKMVKAEANEADPVSLQAIRDMVLDATNSVRGKYLVVVDGMSPMIASVVDENDDEYYEDMFPSVGDRENEESKDEVMDKDTEVVQNEVDSTMPESANFAKVKQKMDCEALLRRRVNRLEIHLKKIQMRVAKLDMEIKKLQLKKLKLELYNTRK